MPKELFAITGRIERVRREDGGRVYMTFLLPPSQVECIKNNPGVSRMDWTDAKVEISLEDAVEVEPPPVVWEFTADVLVPKTNIPDSLYWELQAMAGRVMVFKLTQLDT